MYDYFVAELHCRGCGTVHATTAYTNMQTHIRGGGADGSELTVGTLLPAVYLSTEHLVASGYALIAAPSAAGSARLLGVWICSACDTEQWAMVEIASGRIERIEAVVMNRATFEGANFIDDTQAELLASRLLGVSWDELAARGVNSIDVLRARLA